MAAIPGRHISFFRHPNRPREVAFRLQRMRALRISEDDSQELSVQPAKIIHSKKSRNALT
jgi:hypothetical protein